jgi:GAF domain-containing protein
VQVDRAQYETGQGPCLDTLYERKTVRVSDMADEGRWPEFSARAGALGVGSMLAVQLYVRGADLGALNLTNSASDSFDADSEHVALLFASHAAVAMAGAQAQEGLREGIRRRDLIGQAKGVLMERYAIGPDRAFALLARLSQDTNRKLHELAEELVTTRQLPRPPTTDRVD